VVNLLQYESIRSTAWRSSASEPVEDLARIGTRQRGRQRLDGVPAIKIVEAVVGLDERRRGRRGSGIIRIVGGAVVQGGIEGAIEVGAAVSDGEDQPAIDPGVQRVRQPGIGGRGDACVLRSQLLVHPSSLAAPTG